MFLGYNTNGFAHHRLEDAIAIIAELGYGGVALTLDVHHLNPNTSTVRDCERVAGLLAGCKPQMRAGNRIAFPARPPAEASTDARERSPRGAERRSEFLAEVVETATDMGLPDPVVSFWSGAADDDAGPAALMDRLVDECRSLAVYAASKNVRLAFEPEPGMFIDTMDKFAELHAKVNHPAFGLTLDVGHLVCNGELPVSRHLTAWKHVLWNVHIEDMKRGVHDHVMFGEGEVDFADVFAGLREAKYDGGVYVELSRHSFDAVNAARKAKAFLDGFVR